MARNDFPPDDPDYGNPSRDDLVVEVSKLVEAMKEEETAAQVAKYARDKRTARRHERHGKE